MTTPKLHLLRRAAAVAVATAIASIALAVPAGAAPVPAPSPGSGTSLNSGVSAVAGARALQNCPAAFACLWPVTDWRGDHWWQGTRNNTPVPQWINDASLSTANHDTSRVACFFNNPNGRDGERMREGPFSVRANLVLDPKPSGGNWAREISALTWNCPA